MRHLFESPKVSMFPREPELTFLFICVLKVKWGKGTELNSVLILCHVLLI